jgi:hypothetical protein
VAQEEDIQIRFLVPWEAFLNFEDWLTTNPGFFLPFAADL